MPDFVYEIPVRFADVDRAGILYYPRFLNYFHVAFEEFFDARLGLPYADLIQRDRVGFPMVHLEVDFKAPLPYGDAARVALRPTRLGKSSIDFSYEVRSRNRGAVTTTARATVVTVHLDTFGAVPIPAGIRGLLQAMIDARALEEAARGAAADAPPGGGGAS